MQQLILPKNNLLPIFDIFNHEKIKYVYFNICQTFLNYLYTPLFLKNPSFSNKKPFSKGKRAGNGLAHQIGRFS